MDEQEQAGPVRGECFCMGAGPQATAVLKGLSLGPATAHFHNSRLEFLKGIRSLIDARIAKLQRSEQRQKGTSVPVD